MSKVVVIGGGASGLFSAIYASTINNQVCILEKSDSLGKKILATGNGRCNYWNSDINYSHYNSFNIEKVKEIITENNKNTVLSFFEEKGLVPYIKNGYYYPYSKEASTIRKILIDEIEKRNITYKCNFNVVDITKVEDGFIINKDKENIKCDKLIIATGSLSYYKDSNMLFYDIAKSFGHNIIKPLPSLVQLISTPENYLKMWENTRCDVKVSLEVDQKILKEEIGEVMLTNYGLSGICIFNLSSKVNRLLDIGKRVFININFASWCTDFKEYLDEHKEFSIYDLLFGFLPSKMVDVIISEMSVNKDIKIKDLDSNDLEKLYLLVTKFKVEIKDSKGYSNSQVCSGGISLDDIDTSSMESLLVDNLYFVGEIVDVDGDCGGFNLAFAFITGALAGMGCVDND